MAEAWVATYKTELVNWLGLTSYERLEHETLEWISFYNHDRLHEELGERMSRSSWNFATAVPV